MAASKSRKSSALRQVFQKEVTVSDFREKLHDLFATVRLVDAAYLLTKHNKPVAGVVSVGEAGRLKCVFEKEVTVSDLREELPDLIDRARILGHSYLVTIHGKHVGAVIPVDESATVAVPNPR